MKKDGVPSKIKGASTTTPPVVNIADDARTENAWCAARNNATNAWYVNLNNGNCNNTNTYNRYVAVPVSELVDEGCDYERFLLAEEKCYKNKHNSIEAARVHYNLRIVADLAKELHNGTWKQGTAIVFGITYPTLREVWAAAYTDRILHHDVAPILVEATERIHAENGNVSHGNRKGHSAYTAACQIMQYMKEHPDWIVAKRDISGFFMSINKERSYQNMLPYFTDHSKDNLIHSLITHNPTNDCEMRSPASMMMRIPKNKSLFYAREGCGLPIGNFYSQLDANAYLKDVDALAMSDKWRDRIRYTRFVDDICIVADSVKTANEFFNDVERVLCDIELKFNRKKRYMQPVIHGVSFCGYTIHSHGIYISNRTRNACIKMVKEAKEGYISADRVVRSLNSYFGFFSHCKAWNIQKDISKMVYEKYGAYTQQYVRHGQIVFRMAYKYSEKGICENNRKIYLRNLNRRLRERKKRMFNL